MGGAVERLVAAQVGRVVLDSSSARTMVGSAMSDAKGTLFMEMHGFRGSRAEGALGRFLRHGGKLEVLASDKVVADDLLRANAYRDLPTGALDHAAEGADAVAQGRIRFVPYEHYQHSKMIGSTRGGAGGRPTVLMNNVKVGDMSSSRPDIAVELTGRSADAALDVIRTTIRGGSPARLARKLDAARAVGVLWNDPRAGRTHLADAMHALPDQARESLMVVSKGIDSDAFAHSLVAARQRGVRVGVSVADISRSSAKILREGEVPTYLHAPRAEKTRINLMIADGEVGIASTAYEWDRMLAESADGIYPRESGVVLDRAAIAQLHDPMLKSHDTSLALRLLDDPEPALTSHITPGSMYQPGGWSPLSLVDSHAMGDSRLVRALE
ncbi:MAG: hypothetical protein JWN72_1288 [Thermoleophilia bacterium]|nr:hypothetical protein [Thermoleophilia bacterium]